MVFINLVEISAYSVHAGEGYAVELQQTVGGSFLGVALLVVEDESYRPADGNTVVAVQARMCMAAWNLPIDEPFSGFMPPPLM